MSETSREHKESSPRNVRFALLTISTSRYDQKVKGLPFTDASGDLATRMLTSSGHTIVCREVVSDEADMIRESLVSLTSDAGIDAVLTMGGTGITTTDLTIETVKPILEKELEGFGEAFRMLSFQQIGTAAILTRCTAGVIRGKAVFCLPGSPQAVKTAVAELIVSEVGHILAHANQ